VAFLIPSFRLPAFLQAQVEAAARVFLQPEDTPSVDFGTPIGEAALAAPDSVAWQVFRNPLSLFIGGVAAVVLEFAEPAVRSGVWEHSSFRGDPVGRLRRTGLAAMVTVYAARSVAEAMIAGVRSAHDRVAGTTPAGRPYRADDPELLAWVQGTAAFGFLEAFARFVAPLTLAERDRFYAEGMPAARLYGADGAPASTAEMNALFRHIRPRLEPSPHIAEFLDIVRKAPLLPSGLAPVQDMLVRAAVDIVPPWARAILGLGEEWALRPWETPLIATAARVAHSYRLDTSPPAQACVRMGLPPDYLHRARRGR
jgi:uncharacterized protein (DUF2236 family)